MSINNLYKPFMDRKNIKNKEDREKEIFKAAVRVIKEDGFHKAKMSDVAKAAGISYGLVYHYYRSKEALFDAIVSRWWNRLFQLESELRGKDLALTDKLRAVTNYFLDAYQRDPELVNVFVTESSNATTKLNAKRLEYSTKFVDRVDALMSEGQESGLLRRDIRARYLSYIFLGALNTIVAAMVFADEKIRDDDQKIRIADSILDLFLNGAKRQ
jgi:TetR/AcrR family transcriptional regulator, fatty acid metabolism regulator protein